MDAAATRWRATCCAAAATCVASGQAHFPHLPCTSPSSEQGLSLTLGLRVCLCVRVCAVRVRAASVTQSGSELRVRVAGLLCSTPTIPAPPLATELLSEGPAPRRSSFYLFTVCSSSSLFLPTRLRPAATAFCSRTPVPLGGRSQVAAGHEAEDAMPHGVQGARGTLTGLGRSQFCVQKGLGTPSQNARGMRGLAGGSGRRARVLVGEGALFGWGHRRG